jgi:type I restriction enzyme S subunit
MNWPVVKLGEISRPKQWPTLAKKGMTGAGYQVYGANGPIGFTDQYTHAEDTILVGCRGSCGSLHIMPAKSYANGNAMALDELKTNRVSLQYLYRALQARGFDDVITGTSQPQIIKSNIERVEIPLPPLPEQKRIAGILDQADALRRLRARALEKLNTLGQAIFQEMFGEGVTRRRLALHDLGTVSTGNTPSTAVPEYFDGDIPFITPGDLEGRGSPKWFLSEAGANASRTVVAGSTFVCCIGATIGKMGIAVQRSAFNQQINAVEWGPSINPTYGYYAVQQLRSTIVHQGVGAATTLPILKKSSFQKLTIPVPAMSMQEEFDQRILRCSVVITEAEIAQESSESLFASLQHRAFRGEL